MTKISFLTLLSFCLFQVSFAQKRDIKFIINEAKEAFKNNDYELTLQKIDEIKIEFNKNTPPPIILSMEIISKSNIIKNDPLASYELIVNTRNLIKNYIKNPNSKKDTNFNTVISENKLLSTYPKDLASFNEIKEQKQKEIALEKEQLEKKALELKQKSEADRIKKIEEDRINRIVTDRKNKLRPYTNPAMFSEYELARFSESEFNEKLEKAIQESIIKKEEEKIAKEIEKQRLTKLQPYIIYVNSNDKYNIGTYSEERFEEILENAKSDFKVAEKRNKPKLGSFSSIGFQSGEIAKYGFIYERGGTKTVGFRISARTSLTSEKDILNGTATKNKTEIELGPNFRILNRLYLNIGFGYGYYERLLNNDFAGDVFLEKTGYSVATTGLMFRISRSININGGASFMDIEKDFYKPEITFGISFNLKNKNDSEINSSQTQQKRKSVSSRNYKRNLSSFSSLGFYSGKNAKYGLFYETGGNRVTGFHVSARTSLKEETIINDQLILNRSELALGPNFRMSNRLYLNLGVGYGIYDYGLSNDIYMGTDDYFTANAGIMFRVSKVININAGYSFENFDIEYDKPEMTLGISFNIWD